MRSVILLHGRSQAGRRRAPGFSLVELLVVAALLVVMYALYFSPASPPAQRRRQSKCRSNLQFLYLAAQMYATDHAERWPALRQAATSDQPLSLLVPRYTTRTELFTCAGGRQPALPTGQPFAGRRISYAYLMGLSSTQLSAEQWTLSDAQIDTRPKNTNAPLFASGKSGPGSNHRQFGGNVLFGDGHAAFSPPLARWPLTQPPGTLSLNPKP